MKLPILFLATLATFLCVENVSAQWLRGRFGSAELEEMMRDVEKDIVKIKALLQKKKDISKETLEPAKDAKKEETPKPPPAVKDVKTMSSMF